MSARSKCNTETTPAGRGFPGEQCATWPQRIRNLLRACCTEVLFLLHLAILYLLDSIGIFHFLIEI
jgi:hypothetical protein